MSTRMSLLLIRAITSPCLSTAPLLQVKKISHLAYYLKCCSFHYDKLCSQNKYTIRTYQSRLVFVTSSWSQVYAPNVVLASCLSVLRSVIFLLCAMLVSLVIYTGVLLFFFNVRYFILIWSLIVFYNLHLKVRCFYIIKRLCLSYA